MNFFTYDSLAYYRLGEFVASNMLNGIVHPDMQLDNIGLIKEGINVKLIFKDFADCLEINIPDCLSADICKKLTQTLIPIIEDIKGSFSGISSFRMGFIALGGLLGHAIFLNTLNMGISSSWYTKSSFLTPSYDPSFLYSDTKSKLLIRNWKKQPFDQITPEKYYTLDEYERSKKSLRISETNRYYLDILYYSRGYTCFGKCLHTIFPSDGNIKQNNPVLTYNIFSMDLSCNFYIEKMAETALRNKHYYTAYGLFCKCLFADHIVDEIRETSQNGISFISKTTHMSSSVCSFIMENLNLDLFELMWLLDDLDQNKTLLN